MVEYRMEPPRRNVSQTSQFSVPPSQTDVLGKLEQVVHARQRPTILSFDQKVVVISDLVADIDNFSQQLETRQKQLASTWPCVLLKPAALLGDGETVARWTPLDLELAPQVIDAESAAMSAARAGFDVQHVDLPSASRSFFMGIADAIRTRLSASLGSIGKGSGQSSSPPSTLVEVWATANLQTVLFAKGYFVSTQQGFGMSNPAKRALPHGQYSFGINRGGVPDFDKTVWAVPQVTKVVLSKP
jgi:hypothetical protein